MPRKTRPALRPQPRWHAPEFARIRPLFEKAASSQMPRAARRRIRPRLIQLEPAPPKSTPPAAPAQTQPLIQGEKITLHPRHDAVAGRLLATCSRATPDRLAICMCKPIPIRLVFGARIARLDLYPRPTHRAPPTIAS